jgi:hypothetical protein
MKLRRRPVAPRELSWIIIAVGGVHPDWEAYLRPSVAIAGA